MPRCSSGTLGAKTWPDMFNEKNHPSKEHNPEWMNSTPQKSNIDTKKLPVLKGVTCSKAHHLEYCIQPLVFKG